MKVAVRTGNYAYTANHRQGSADEGGGQPGKPAYAAGHPQSMARQWRVGNRLLDYGP